MKTIFLLITFILLKFYSFSQTFTYQAVTNYPFPNMVYGNAMVGDINNDNTTDVILTGRFSIPLYDTCSIIYFNDGNANFTLSDTLKGMTYNNGALGDIDGDNDLDLIIMGKNTLYHSYPGSNLDTSQTYLYKFNGTNYTLVPNSNIINLSNASAEFSDIDGDNDLDLLVMGVETNDSIPITKLYKNDGNGNFSEILNTNIMNLSNGDISFGDIDGDNDNDFIITGFDSTLATIKTILYTNDGNGVFSETILNTYQTQYSSYYSYLIRSSLKTHLFDADNDNDLDLIISSEGYVYFYENNGNGLFSINQANVSEISNLPNFSSFDDTYIEDFDQDGDLDLIIKYSISSSSNINFYLAVLENDGLGNFINLTQITNHFYIYDKTEFVFFDADNDSDLDILNTASTYYNNLYDGLYLYDVCYPTYNTIYPVYCKKYISPSGKTYTQSGIYQDTIFNSKWCDSIITIDLTIKTVDVSISTINDTTLIANQDNATYIWGWCYNGNISTFVNATNQTYTPQFLTEGSYGVIVSYNGCTDTSECINYYLSLNDFGNSDVRIYPNPTNDYIYIENINLTNYKIKVTNALGNEICFTSYSNSSSSLKVDLRSFKKGVYFIKIINSNNDIKTYKIIKN